MWRLLISLCLAIVLALTQTPRDELLSCTYVAGYIQAYEALRRGDKCFCGDGNIRLFFSQSQGVVGSVTGIRPQNETDTVKIKHHGAETLVARGIFAQIKMPGESNTETTFIQGEAAACLQLCDMAT